MKLLKLTIHNIASIEDAVIDFEHGPLAEDSRFLICGPTGAGKSTLLDAICMALYATTPRLKNAKSEGYVDDTEKYSLSGSEDKVKIDDPRMLMRRGSLDASIELVFTDKDEKPLKTIWACQRAYNKKDGNIKTPTFHLIDASDDTVISAKKTEILKLIEERIGLTFEQFCRTTMLAQGEFTKFLRSEGKNKSQILEKLTGTDVFSEISRQIHRTKVEKSTACELVKNQMQGVQLLSEEEQAVIHQQEEELKKQIVLFTKEEKELSSQLLWFNQFLAIQKENDHNKTLFLLKEKEMQAPSFLAEKQLLDDWHTTVVQRELWKEREQAVLLLEQKKEELVSLKEEYQSLCAGLLDRKLTIERNIERRLKAQQFLVKEEPFAECYRQMPLIQSQAQYYQQTCLKQNELEKQILTAQEKLKELDALLSNDADGVKKLVSLLETKQKELDVLDFRLKDLDYEGLLSRQRDLTLHQNRLKELRVLVEQSDRLKKTVSEKDDAFKLVQQLVNQSKQEFTTAEKIQKELNLRLKVQEEIFEKQKMACDDLIKEYRKHLSVGDICPLCGQPIRNLSTDEHFVSVLQPIQKSLKQLRDELQHATTISAEKKAQLITNTRESELKQKELESVRKQEEEISGLKEAHPFYQIFQQSETPITEIDGAYQEKEEELSQLDLKLKEVGGVQNQKAILQKEKEVLEKSVRLAENKVKDVEKLISVTNERLKTNQNQMGGHAQTLKGITENLSAYIDMDLFVKNADVYLDTLKKRADLFQRATDEYEKIERLLQTLQTEQEPMNRIKETIGKFQEPWKEVVVTEPLQIEQLSSKWMDLQNEVALNKEICQQADLKFRQADEQLKKYFMQSDAVSENRLTELVKCPLSEVESLRKRHQMVGEQVASLKTLMETSAKNLQLHEQNRPVLESDFDSQTTFEKQNRIKEALNAANQELGKLQQSLETDKKNKSRFAAIHKEFETASKELQRWERLHDLFGSSEGDKFRNIAQSYVLEQLLMNANSYLRQFTNRYEMECQPGSLTIILRDKEVGGVLRPVSTISGGESFLISLSLALGLSSLSRNSISMDTLFIDEGFGTLDSTYLSTVMDALERLHQIGGKRIGIISHVESLKERLTTQIQVSRINNTLSKVEVVSLI